MKFNKKVVLILAVALMMVSPVLSMGQNLTTTVKAADDQTENNRLFIGSVKSYIYNNKGKRTTYKGKSSLKYGSRVDYLGKFSDYNGKNKYYFMDTKGYKKFASYKIIKGKAYFPIGKNAYVRVVNVAQINDRPLYAKSLSVVVSPKYVQKQGQYAFDADNNIIKGVYFKPGKKLTIDAQEYVTNGNHTDTIYRVKGTKQFIYANRLKTAVRQQLEILSTQTHVIMNKDTHMYLANGELKTKKPNTNDRVSYRKGQRTVVDQLVYLWVPSENKAELFYRVESGWTPAGSEGYEPTTSLGYVKVSDVDYDFGPQMVDPDNTAAEAEAGKAVATSSDKAELNSLINENLEDNNLYKFSSLSQQWNYAGALQNAKEINDSKTATINEVNQAVWELKFTKNELSGEKVKIDNLGWIDNSTANKIVHTAGSSYRSNQNVRYAIDMVNHNTVLRLREFAVQSNGSDTNHLLATRELNINDYVTVTDPNPTEKAGYQSSLSEKNLTSNSTLKKYADLIDYNELTTNLVAKTNTPIYTNSYKNNYANVSKGNVNLTRTSQIIKKGNNIGYKVGPIVRVKGQYYAMVRSKKRYFYVRADAIARDNFTKDAAYKKYSKMIDDAVTSENSTVLVTPTQNTVTYERNSYGELGSSRPYKKGTMAYYIAEPHVMKYNGEWYFISGYPTYSGTTYIAKTVKLSKNTIMK